MLTQFNSLIDPAVLIERLGVTGQGWVMWVTRGHDVDSNHANSVRAKMSFCLNDSSRC